MTQEFAPSRVSQASVPIPFEIHPESSEEQALIEPLLDRAFGPDRRARTVYRLRDRPPAEGLSYVARHADGRLLANIRYWPVMIGKTPAILLGPLAVEPSIQGRGVGKALVAHSLGEAIHRGHRICIVVGEPDYYAAFGFRPASEFGLILPGPVDPHRFQARELVSGALKGVSGLISPAPVGTPGQA